jgi:hypothetical protein
LHSPFLLLPVIFYNILTDDFWWRLFWLTAAWLISSLERSGFFFTVVWESRFE